MTLPNFDEALQATFAERAAARAGSHDNAVKGALMVMPRALIAVLPPRGSDERRGLEDMGAALLADGKVGVVILAGGMATRFGGVVKAIVPAHDGKTFLQLKLADAKARGARALVMSSAATHDAILAHVADMGRDDVDVFPQMTALRLRPDGTLYRDAAGEVSPYATGHGDLTFALRASGALARFRAAGGTTLLMSNVDNLGATLDPAILGFHAGLGAAITAEVVRKDPGDKGGAPAMLDGVPQIIEGFRFPPGFDQDQIDVFNTNTFVLDAAAIDRDFRLPYYRVEKQVDGEPVIQFERLAGELTAHLPTRFVEVPRTGADTRFVPVKDPDELERSRELIAAVVARA